MCLSAPCAALKRSFLLTTGTAPVRICCIHVHLVKRKHQRSSRLQSQSLSQQMSINRMRLETKQRSWTVFSIAHTIKNSYQIYYSTNFGHRSVHISDSIWSNHKLLIHSATMRNFSFLSFHWGVWDVGCMGWEEVKSSCQRCEESRSCDLEEHHFLITW